MALAVKTVAVTGATMTKSARLLLLAVWLALTPLAARAQSNPGLTFRQVPTAAQWNSYFAAKQDYSPVLTNYANLGGTGILQLVSGIPTVGTLSGNFDATLGSTPGMLAIRGLAGWTGLQAGPTGTCLTSAGATAVPTWGSCGTTSSGGGGTVTSVGLSMPGIFTVTNSPIATAGTIGVSLAAVNANLILAGPLTGAATAPTFRSLGGGDMPLPGATTLGAFMSKAAISHQWLNSATTSGTFTATQPACADISDASAACNTAIGTSGPTIPLLNANVNWSGISGLGRVRVASRTATAAGAVAVSGTTDFIVCVNKTVAAATTVNLPAGPSAGDTYVIADCKGDAATNNITVTPPAGAIDGASTFVINTAFAAQGFTYMGSNFWKAN